MLTLSAIVEVAVFPPFGPDWSEGGKPPPGGPLPGGGGPLPPGGGLLPPGGSSATRWWSPSPWRWTSLLE